MFQASHNWCRIEVHASDEAAPNKKAVLKLFDCRQSAQPQIGEIILGDFCGLAQSLFAKEMMENLGIDQHSKHFARRMKALRKALGYSYP